MTHIPRDYSMSAEKQKRLITKQFAAEGKTVLRMTSYDRGGYIIVIYK